MKPFEIYKKYNDEKQKIELLEILTRNLQKIYNTEAHTRLSKEMGKNGSYLANAFRDSRYALTPFILAAAKKNVSPNRLFDIEETDIKDDSIEIDLPLKEENKDELKIINSKETLKIPFIKYDSNNIKAYIDKNEIYLVDTSFNGIKENGKYLLKTKERDYFFIVNIEIKINENAEFYYEINGEIGNIKLDLDKFNEKFEIIGKVEKEIKFEVK